jgi:predicted CXXCH cytochrome family protein
MKSALLLLMVLLLFAARAPGADAPAGAHGELACSACHLGEALVDCDACHAAAENPHPVGVEAPFAARSEFALGPGGLLLCRSCHQVNGGDPALGLVARNGTAAEGFPSRRKFCALCHPAGMEGISAHDAEKGEARCRFCHARLPDGGEPAAATLRAPAPRLCSFCHQLEARPHWQAQAVAPELPEDGVPTVGRTAECHRCHDPHGTTGTVHYLRPAVARAIGRVQEENPHIESYFACPACHTTSFADKICPPDCALLYGGEIVSLCLSCHVTSPQHHPVGVELSPEKMTRLEIAEISAPLDRDGEITCSTCHDNGCATGHQAMRVRHYDRDALRNDLCWSCHARSELAEADPHSDDPDACRWCHQTRPEPGGDKGLLAGPSMVCLQCHEVVPHPGGANHLRPARDGIQVDPALPLREDGRVVCVTCHDPHLRTRLVPTRLRADRGKICSLCHRR